MLGNTLSQNTLELIHTIFILLYQIIGEEDLQMKKDYKTPTNYVDVPYVDHIIRQTMRKVREFELDNQATGILLKEFADMSQAHNELNKWVD